jgi:plastocyanin
MLPLVVVLLAVLLPSTASAEEEVLTLYSPPIQTLPYVHDSHTVRLKADGKQAPAKPGYVLGFIEQVLVDSKKPNAKPLSNAKFMIHHFVYFAPGRIEDSEGGCWKNLGFIGGRGEEHPSGNFERGYTAETRSKYGVVNKTANGTAPDWFLLAMVMNHVKKPKKVYVRTKLYYTEEERQPAYPTTVGDCGRMITGMAYDVPGDGPKGSTYTNTSKWTAPYSGRILLAGNHQHGGGKNHTLYSDTCQRTVLKGNVYHGTEDHIYNTIRPVLHEPGPIATGTLKSDQGIPIEKGEQFTRTARHDNGNLHVQAMGFWALWLVKDDTVGHCDPMPDDVKDIGRPKRFDKTPADFYARKVPQLAKQSGGFSDFTGSPLAVGDDFFRPGRITAKLGEPVTWEFTGVKPHTVTVANGPQGFSTHYVGQTSGKYTFTPPERGLYRMTCLVHPTTMGQDLRVE